MAIISFVNKRAKYEPDPSHFYLISAFYVLMFKVGSYVKINKTFFFSQKLDLIEHQFHEQPGNTGLVKSD